MKSVIGSCPWYQRGCAALPYPGVHKCHVSWSDGFYFLLVAQKKMIPLQGKSNSKPQPAGVCIGGQEVKNSCLNAFVLDKLSSLQERMIYQFKPVRYRIEKPRMGSEAEEATNARRLAVQNSDVGMTSGST